MVFNVFAQAITVENRQRWLSVVHIGGLALKLVVSYLLIERYGVIGVVVASVSVELLKLIALMQAFRPAWGSMLIHSARFIGLVILSTAAMWALGQVHPVIGMAGGLIYAGGVLLLLKPDEWDLLYRLAAAVPGGSLITRVWRRDITF